MILAMVVGVMIKVKKLMKAIDRLVIICENLINFIFLFDCDYYEL
jgi:hypothetical protein